MSDEANNVVQAAIAAATAMTQNINAGARLALIPNGYKLADLEKYLPIPQRKRGNVQVHTVGSLVQYVNRHKTGSTQIYANMEPPRFVAVIDDHADNNYEFGAGFGEHRVSYAPPLSPEWKTWMGSNGCKFTQEGFALFLEQNVVDVMKPVAGNLLDIARTLQATTGAKFRSGVNLSNGSVQITYEEEVNGSAGHEGKTTIPEEFVLGIPVMQGGPRFEVTAKFRYSIKQGVLSLSYDLVRPHKVIEAAVEDIVKAIQATDTPVAPSAKVDDHGVIVSQAPTPDAGTGIAVLYGVPRNSQE